MAGVRYICNYISNGVKGVTTSYTIRIYDNDLTSDLNIEFQCSPSGAEIAYRGKTKELPIGIIPSSCAFTMQIQNDTHNNIVNQFKNAARGRFMVDVSKYGSTIWLGVIRTDGIVRENMSYPFGFQIIASDSIQDLQDVELNHDDWLVDFDNYTTGDAYIRLTNILVHGIRNLPYYTMMNQQELLKTRNEWFSDQHTSLTNDPLYYTSVFIYHYYDLSNLEKTDHGGWISGTFKNINIFDAIEELCVEFNARFYQSNNGWIFEQINTRITDTYNEWVYDSDGALNYYGSNSLNYTTIDQTSANAAILTGSSWLYIPALKTVRINADLGQDQYLAENKHWGTGDTGIKQLNHVIVNDGSYSTELSIGVGLDFEIVSPKPNSLSGVWVVFDIYLKIGTYYWKRDIVSRYLTYDPDTFTIHEFPQEWTATSGINYEIAVDRFRATSDATNYYMNGRFQVNTLTPTLLEGGEPDMEVRFLGLCANAEDVENEIYIGTGTYTNTWETTYVQVDYISNQDVVKIKQTLTTEASYSNDNIDELDVKLNLTGGGAVYSRNALYAWDGSAWVYGDNWGYDTLSGTKTLHKVLAQEMLGARKLSLRVIEGNIFSEALTIENQLVYDNVKYIASSITFVTGQEEINGEWIELSRDISGISFPAPEEDHELRDGGISKDGFDSISIEQGLDSNGGKAPLITDQIANLNEDDLTGVVTSITIFATSYNIAQTGDLLYLINKDRGISDVLTITADVLKGATTIEVTGTLTNEYFTYDLIYIQRPYEQGLMHNETKLYHYFIESHSSTIITIPTAGAGGYDLLPNTTTDNLIHKRYSLYVGGTKKLYNGTFGYTISGQTLVLEQGIRDVDIEFKAYKIDT